MLAVLGTLGLLQSLLLPGLILRKALRFRCGISEGLIRLLPLSLTANYLLVFLLTALRIFSRPVMLAVILAETAALILLYKDTLRKPVNEFIKSIWDSLRIEFHPLQDFLNENTQNVTDITGKWVWALTGCFALSGLLWALHLCRLNFGTVFSGWDTLFSWNAYAEIWAGGDIPRIGGMYPQLIPANWAISYELQGPDAVQFFNTLLPPLFFLLIQWMLFDLGFQRRESGFFIAAVIARYMMKKLMGDHLFDGYMDVPAAAMILLSLYTLIRADRRDDRGKREAILLSVIFAAAAAVTKQSGAAALILVPLAIRQLMGDTAKSLSRREKLTLAAAGLLIALPWYLFCLLSVSAGPEKELIADGITEFNRQYDIHHRIRLALETLGRYKFVFLGAILLLPFVEKRYRLLLLLMVWPLALIWMVSYSYDARNLGPVLPIVALTGGLGLAGAGRFAAGFAERTRTGRIPLWVLAFILAALLAAVLIKRYPDTKLIRDHEERQKALFGERLNRELLYGILGENHGGYDIYTDYPAQFLSGYAECCSAAELTDAGQVRSVLEGDKINWLLLPVIMPNNTDPSRELIEQCIASGKCERVRCSDGYYKEYCLYEIKR